MVEPLKLKQIALAGKKTAIMGNVKERVRQKPELLVGEPIEVRKRMVSMLMEAVRVCARGPLFTIIDNHVSAMLAEYSLLEGPEPPHGSSEWWDGLLDALLESFTGDVETLLGEEGVLGLVEDAANIGLGVLVEKLTGAILTVWTGKPADVFEALGVGVADIEALIAPPKAAPPRDGRSSRWSTTAVEPSALTAAARQALVALSDVAGMREADVAALIGVSRTQALNYRHGKTLFAPTAEQIDALVRKLGEAAETLDAAVAGLESAVLQ